MLRMFALYNVKAFSWEALGDFQLKTQIWKGNMYLTKNPFGRNEICCVGDIIVKWVTCVQNDYQI